MDYDIYDILLILAYASVFIVAIYILCGLGSLDKRLRRLSAKIHIQHMRSMGVVDYGKGIMEVYSIAEEEIGNLS